MMFMFSTKPKGMVPYCAVHGQNTGGQNAKISLHTFLNLQTHTQNTPCLKISKGQRPKSGMWKYQLLNLPSCLILAGTRSLAMTLT